MKKIRLRAFSFAINLLASGMTATAAIAQVRPVWLWVIIAVLWGMNAGMDVMRILDAIGELRRELEDTGTGRGRG